MKFEVVTEGGNIAIDATDEESAFAQFTQWAQSVQDGNTAFINCTSGIWLWDIVAMIDEDKAEEIKNAFYGTQNEAEVLIKEEYGEPSSGEEKIEVVNNEGTLDDSGNVDE